MRIIIALCIGLAAAGVLAYYLIDGSDDPGITGTSDHADPGTDIPDPGIRPEPVLTGLDIPWSVDWLPDGTMLFTERGGILWSWDGDTKKEILKLDVAGGEGGLLGLAIDPEYETNRFIYLYHTYDEFPGGTKNKVTRYTLDHAVEQDRVIYDGIPGSPWHDGGRIQFGPDGYLYVATGDAIMPHLAQDPSSPAGKILRLDRDGNIPDDNPFPGSPVYSSGHRNPQGMDWDMSGRMVITEHGPSGIDTGRDEINVIVPGGNYGWPRVTGDESGPGLRDPAYHTGDDTWAPSGSEFYYGDMIPEWDGKYLVAGLRGQSLYVLDLDQDTIVPERWYHGEFGRLRDVQTGPDGYLYVLTSNGNKDMILRIKMI